MYCVRRKEVMVFIFVAWCLADNDIGRAVEKLWRYRSHFGAWRPVCAVAMAGQSLVRAMAGNQNALIGQQAQKWLSVTSDGGAALYRKSPITYPAACRQSGRAGAARRRRRRRVCA